MLLSIHAAWLLLIAPLAIRSRHRQRFLAPRLAATIAGTESDVVNAFRRALRWLPFLFTCLERAGALHRLLHSRGFPSRLLIGVKAAPNAPRISAHAWVEYPPGHPLLDEGQGDFGILRSACSPAETK